jgi:hypothetical protein
LASPSIANGAEAEATSYDSSSCGDERQQIKISDELVVSSFSVTAGAMYPPLQHRNGAPETKTIA